MWRFALRKNLSFLSPRQPEADDDRKE